MGHLTLYLHTLKREHINPAFGTKLITRAAIFKIAALLFCHLMNSRLKKTKTRQAKSNYHRPRVSAKQSARVPTATAKEFDRFQRRCARKFTVDQVGGCARPIRNKQ